MTSTPRLSPKFLFFPARTPSQLTGGRANRVSIPQPQRLRRLRLQPHWRTLAVAVAFGAFYAIEATQCLAGAPPQEQSLGARFLDADRATISGLPGDKARNLYDYALARAYECPASTGRRGDLAACAVRSAFEGPLIRPASEPSSAEESTMTFALAEGRGSCAALAALTLSVAQDAGVELEAWVHGDHVVVAAPRGAEYFELLEGGRVHQWKLASKSSNSTVGRGTRVSAEEYLGYYLDNLAVRLANSGESARAEMAFQRAVASTPRAARIRFNYGTFLLNGKRTSEAITELRRSVRLDSSNADAWTNLGVAYAQAGETSKAQRSFKQALRIDPRNANARRNLDAVTSGVGASSAPPPR